MYLQCGILCGDLFWIGIFDQKKLATEREQNFVCLHCIPKAHEQDKKVDETLLEMTYY